MASAYVAKVLRDEIVLALGTAPVASLIGNVVTNALQGGVDGYDLADGPGIIVSYPELIASVGISGGDPDGGVSRVEYGVTLRIYGGEANAKTADENRGKYECAIRVALSKYTSVNMTKLGWCRNALSIAPVGLLTRGQNYIYEMVLNYTLFVPANGLVNI